MRELSEEHCRSCSGIPPMERVEAEENLRLLSGWNLVDDQIIKEYKFDSYRDGLEFTHSIGLLAESEDHHPDILLRWRKVRLTFSTHSIKGLSLNDFIMAAKSDREYQKSNDRQKIA